MRLHMAQEQSPPPYPEGAAARNRWVRDLRGPRNALDSWKPYAHLFETEAAPFGAGEISTATVFLTNRECPFSCVMCDLWQNTLTEAVPHGAIAAQIRYALSELPPAQQIKLYNAGSFFDTRAIPPADYADIAREVAGFERVVVECHPAFLGDDGLRFRDLIGGQLEVAVGLETAHPGVLEKLNKQITLDSFRRAADFLAREHIALRVFILVRPPFLTEDEGVEWAKRSLDLGFDCGAEVCCLIPTRGGNGAMEALAQSGDFAPPCLASLEEAQVYGLQKNAGRVFADLWDIEKFYTDADAPVRAARIAEMNRTQEVNAHV